MKILKKTRFTILNRVFNLVEVEKSDVNCICEKCCFNFNSGNEDISYLCDLVNSRDFIINYIQVIKDKNSIKKLTYVSNLCNKTEDERCMCGYKIYFEQEDTTGCDFCNNKAKISESEYSEIYITRGEDGIYKLVSKGLEIVEKEILYCPICGRKL